MLQVSFEGVRFEAPETPQYLEVALRLLEVRRRELGGGGPSAPREGGEAGPVPLEAPPPRSGERERVRWFVTHWPRLLLPDGQTRLLRSREEVEEFLRSRGLQPHKRGDASMLLWQVRQRLKIPVEAVPRDRA